VVQPGEEVVLGASPPARRLRRNILPLRGHDDVSAIAAIGERLPLSVSVGGRRGQSPHRRLMETKQQLISLFSAGF
jgi:hypothetical protein